MDQRVKKLNDGDRGVALVALGKVVAFQHACDSHLACQLEAVLEAHIIEPLAIIDDRGLVLVENLEGLHQISLRVVDDLILSQDGACIRATRGITDQRGKVANDENGFVAEVLELAKLIKYDEMAEGEIRASRVDAKFNAQWSVAVQAILQLGFADDGVGVCANGFDQAH